MRLLNLNTLNLYRQLTGRLPEILTPEACLVLRGFRVVAALFLCLGFRGQGLEFKVKVLRFKV